MKKYTSSLEEFCESITKFQHQLHGHTAARGSLRSAHIPAKWQHCNDFEQTHLLRLVSPFGFVFNRSPSYIQTLAKDSHRGSRLPVGISSSADLFICILHRIPIPIIPTLILLNRIKLMHFSKIFSHSPGLRHIRIQENWMITDYNVVLPRIIGLSHLSHHTSIEHDKVPKVSSWAAAPNSEWHVGDSFGWWTRRGSEHRSASPLGSQACC